MTLKFDEWHSKLIGLLFYTNFSKLCTSFQSQWWIRTGITVRKRSIRVKIVDFWSSVTLQFDEWPWRTIGHLFYATLSFVHHSIAIGVIKLELQSRNAQFGSKSMILSRLTLKFDRWHWKTIGQLSYATSSYVHHFIAICEFKLELWSENTLSWAKFALTSVTSTFDLWLWPLAWTLRLAMVITPENFWMIWW